MFKMVRFAVSTDNGGQEQNWSVYRSIPKAKK